MGGFTKWAEVDLAALRRNVERVRRVVGPSSSLMAVVKANAYGHGAVPVARAALSAGAGWLGVSDLPEALELRRAGIDAPILIFGFVPAEAALYAVEHDLQVTVYDRRLPEALSAAAHAAGRVGRVQLKVDTGMGRLGVQPEEVPSLLGYLDRLNGIEVAGVYTHFAAADAATQGYSQWQLERFCASISAAEPRDWIRHAANSAAALRLPAARLDLVRVGLALYGGRLELEDIPAGAVRAGQPAGSRSSQRVAVEDELEPVLTLKAQVTHLKTVPSGRYIGYGCSYRTRRRSLIATLPVGYADGFGRKQSNRGSVLLRGGRAPVVGRVAMDQVCVDATDLGTVRPGDEAVLIGSQDGDSLSLEQVAAVEGTLNYELLCGISPRVARVYSG